MSHAVSNYDFRDKRADYARLRAELASLLVGEHDLIANAANTSALLFGALPEVNWAGFYFLRGAELVVGPFQGKPACVRIARRGVDYEQYIDRQYLERLNEAYARFFHEFEAAPLLIVNAASIDPLNNQHDYDELLAAIRRMSRGRLYFNPLRNRGL